ncbi:ATP-binding protein [Streptomyces sp. AM 4-1-1]|uniref:ATP-binding protein n=1 Tax=Streptomyces sp. AM 4-1-1 TaxID=3028710 RepID=UPI0023B96CAC|nr:ATP-binding protein [Streptomyces sp. AM 4-1-1]WEH36866.1 ATP-binding protein [Streptomyces sp. AM 4-1-1]
MSQLRAPEARTERREGGRHGRPGARALAPAPPTPGAARTSPESRIRPRLLRSALLPTVAAALSGAVAVAVTVRATEIRPSEELWITLGACGASAVAAVVAAFLGANRTATAVFGRCLALRRSSAHGQAEVGRLMERLRKGETVPARPPAEPAAPGGDAFDLLAHEMARSHETALAAITEASLPSGGDAARGDGDAHRVEVFVNLARRLQSLVHREIQLLDELEHEVEDPDLLKGLFHVDHLATRIRRHAENLAVLGGAVSRRQWSNPVSTTEILRSAIAEVEQYPRVKLVPPIDGTLRGHAVADVIHLLAELVENATVFSSPHTQVLLRAQRVTAGLALEVEDRGLGLPVHEQKRMNALLADPDQVDVAHLLQDGRIGLFVVASLAHRHGIAVRLQSNIYGGTQAVLVLPQALLGPDEDIAPTPQPPQRTHQSPAHQQQAPTQQAHRQEGRQAPAPSRQQQPTPEAEVPTANPRQRLDHPPRQRSAEDRPPPSVRPPEDTPTTALAETGGAGGDPTRPLLPRRTTQEHLAPQLRVPPVPRTEDAYAPHDPGLMAAFQRGVGLAESQIDGPDQPDRGPGSDRSPGLDAPDRTSWPDRGIEGDRDGQEARHRRQARPVPTEWTGRTAQDGLDDRSVPAAPIGPAAPTASAVPAAPGGDLPPAPLPVRGRTPGSTWPLPLTDPHQDPRDEDPFKE